MLFKTPKTKGKARSGRLMGGCGLACVSAKSVLEGRVTRKARLNLRTGSVVGQKRLMDSRLVVRVVRGVIRRTNSGNVLFSKFPEAMGRTRDLRGLLRRGRERLSKILDLRIPERRLVREVLGHTTVRNETSSGRRIVRGEFGRCRTGAGPITSFCSSGKGLRSVRKANAIRRIFTELDNRVRRVRR